MARKGYQGESAKDRAVNLMDKFIQKQEQKKQTEKRRYGRYKDPEQPVYMWPKKDQDEYWANLTPADWFDRDYSSYRTWYDEVQAKSGMYHITFDDCVAKHKSRLRELYEEKLRPRNAVTVLRREKIIH